jgi:hypothetical protein
MTKFKDRVGPRPPPHPQSLPRRINGPLRSRFQIMLCITLFWAQRRVIGCEAVSGLTNGDLRSHTARTQRNDPMPHRKRQVMRYERTGRG